MCWRLCVHPDFADLGTHSSGSETDNFGSAGISPWRSGTSYFIAAPQEDRQYRQIIMTVPTLRAMTCDHAHLGLQSSLPTLKLASPCSRPRVVEADSLFGEDPSLLFELRLVDLAARITFL